MIAVIWFLISILCTTPLAYGKISTEDEVENFLSKINYELAVINNQKTHISWLKDAYYNPESEEEEEEESPEEKELSKQLIELTKYINNEKKEIKLSEIKNSNLKEQLQNLPQLNYEALNDKEMKELEDTTVNMTLIYRSVHLCSYTDPLNCNLTLIPHVQDIIHNSNDLNEIEHYWLEWQTKSGSKSKDDFSKFVKIYRKTSELNGYKKPADYWFRKFGESSKIIKLIDKLIEQIKPLFEQFHARVRGLLREKYGTHYIKENWPYPQHLSEKYIGAAFRNEDHNGIELPFPDAGMPNITEAFLNQGYLPRSFYDVAENFFQSIGLNGLNENYWDNNVLPKGDPSETYLYCTNKVYNYYESDLIKMTHCPNIDLLRYMNMFETVSTIHFHKESKIQSTLFQMEPFPDFLESLGKIFSLSATTPTFLENIGILPNNSYNDEQRMNRLYFLGFQEIFVIPILYVLDKYRVDVLKHGIKTWDNCAYWDLNEKYTGAIPPNKRSNKDFDIPSKLLVAVDEIYTGTILGTAFKYQVYKHFCEKTGEYIKNDPNYPLDYCDLSGHPEIGESITKAMALGSSKPWPEILATLTDGQTELSFDGFLEYFEPLFEWLTRANNYNKAEVGWQESNQCEK